MGRPVKRRSYKSQVRQEQAALTRTRIVEAAGELFAKRGYGPTTIRAIAEKAEVASDTVYAVFGTKARVLTALIDARLGSGAANVMERPEIAAIRDEPDQRRQIRVFAQEMAAVAARVRGVYEILRTAYAVEPAMAEVHAEMSGYRLANMRKAAEWFASRGPLRTDVERAAETIWVFASPDVSIMLCAWRGWTQEEHAAWLEDVLIRSLLPDVPKRRRPS